MSAIKINIGAWIITVDDFEICAKTFRPNQRCLNSTNDVILLPSSLNSEVLQVHDDMFFSFIFQMKNGCFRSAVALVAIVLCLEIVQGSENSLADQGR